MREIISNVKNAKIIAIYREQYGFDDETIELLLKTQKGISSKNEQEYFAMMASLCNSYRGKRWVLTGGTTDLEKARIYFKKLGLTEREIDKLYQSINHQHLLVSDDATSYNLRVRDFAHEMVALAIFKNTSVVGDVSLPIVTARGLLNMIMYGQISQFSSYKGDITSGRFGIDDMQSDTDVNNIYNRYLKNDTSVLSEYNQYNEELSNGQTNRAEEFLKNLGDGDISKGKSKLWEEIMLFTPADEYMSEFSTLRQNLEDYNEHREENLKVYLDFLEEEMRG